MKFSIKVFEQIDALDCTVGRRENTVVTEKKKEIKMEINQCLLLVPGVSCYRGPEAGDEKKSSIILDNWKNPNKISVKQIKLEVTGK